MQELLISIENAIARLPEFCFEKPVNWSLSSGQHWAIVGPNGAGKTIFSNLLTGKIALKAGTINYHLGENNTPAFEKIKSATFQDIYSMADYKNMYYQQRWNASDEEETPMVGDLVKQSGDKETVRQMFALFGIEELLEKRLILLSSGELRKFLIVKMLLSNPRILILDNPYIGLDAPSRELLNDLLVRLSEQRGLQIVLILSNPEDIPEMITHVLPIVNKELKPSLSRTDFLKNNTLLDALFPPLNKAIELPIREYFPADYDSTLEMEHIHIKYGKRTILKDLNWKVLKGEKWALLGPNGAGKSTLLSLVCADNPQAYANTFYLFGKKRGSGESIWDIKKRIGYVSPEIHLYYQQNQACINIVGSGFFDSIGLHRTCTNEQRQIAQEWMKIFRIDQLCDVPFLKLSYGEQRLALLVRAFVKNPDLLILDEPLHGLDKSNKTLALAIIEAFCSQQDKTLIYVTHYLHEIPSCVNQQFVLNKQL